MDLLSRICNFLMIRRRLKITRPWCVPFSFLFFSLFGTSFLFGIALESELRKKFIFFFHDSLPCNSWRFLFFEDSSLVVYREYGICFVCSTVYHRDVYIV